MKVERTADGCVIEHLKNGDIRVNGLLIERPMTSAEARDEVARCALRRYRAGEFDNLRGATNAVLSDRPDLKKLYVGATGADLAVRPR